MLRVIVLGDRYVYRLGRGGKILAARIKPGSDLLRSIRNLVDSAFFSI